MAIKQIDKIGVPYSQAPKRFIVDGEADVASLPPCCPGSSAVAVDEGLLYMVNASGAWKKMGTVMYSPAEGVLF
ncbi:MAG: hypothetical protein J6V15_00855 [Clostridia bacterium]|nr:hypothetical protein [Clostridia bacterium]